METIRASAVSQLHLHARAAQLAPDDPLLHDPAALEPREEVAQRDPGGLQTHRVDPLADPRGLRARAGARQPAQIHERVALARDAGVELDHDLAQPRPERAQVGDRGDDLGAAADVLDAERELDAGTREQLTRAALGAQVRERGVGPLDGDPERAAELVLELGAHIGTRHASSRSAIAHRIRVRSVGRSSSLAESGRIDGSSAEIIVNRARASSRSSTGSSDR